jgi:transposase
MLIYFLPKAMTAALWNISSNLALILQRPKVPPILSTIPESTKVACTTLTRMAPHLAKSQHALIKAMSRSKQQFTAEEIANVACCSPRAIYRINKNLRSTKAPPSRVGRPRSITAPILDALCKHLILKPGLYHDEMVKWVWNHFQVYITTSSLKRALASCGWTKKTIGCIARAQNADLRDLYLYNTSDFRSYHYVFVDESGCDKRVGYRRTGWSLHGVTPVQISQFQREKRYQILPAYTQDGIIFSRVFQGSTDSTVFEDFIEQLLPFMGRWPERYSVLVMDNASFHRTPRIEQMCRDAGVKLVYLLPYSPDLNPIEEFFAELKAFIKRN